MNSVGTDNIINVTRGQQLIHVIREVKKIQEDPKLNKTTEFIIDEANISKFIMIIRPIEGLYMDLTIYFELNVPIGYPAPGHPINVKCLDNIYHPNIFSGGRLCLKYDGVGNFDSGFKETLENLVVAVNYIFIHPENYGYGSNMPKHMENTIKKNVDQYRTRIKMDKCPKQDSDKLYKMKEIYDDKINPSITCIKNWQSYFPSSCLEDIKKSRYYIFTLGGRKIMDLAKLEDVLSQTIRDPRFRFDTAPNIAFMNNEITQQQVMTPSTPFSVVLAKFKRLIYPEDMKWDPINECLCSNTSFDNFFSQCIKTPYGDGKDMVIMCNIIIRSNYNFMFTCQKKYNPNYPILKSKERMEKNRKEYIMTIDQYICNMMAYDNHLAIDPKKDDDSSNEFDFCIDPSNPLWFYISFSALIIGEDIKKMFTNVTFRLNPIDKYSPYVTHIHNDNNINGNHIIDKHLNAGVRLLTEEEEKLVSGTVDEIAKEDEDYYDIELASKYLASSVEQTGLDLSKVRYLN